MKKLIFLFLLTLNSNFGYSNIDTTHVNFEHNKLFYLNSKSNNKLIIFLHGGMSDPFFKTNRDSISLSYLLENNTNLIPMANSNGFDLIIPIKNDSLDWLNNYDYCFSVFEVYIKSLQKKYDEVYISGFSDGGTGSFKIFYTHPENYNGLIVFNGYPNHKWFNKNIDYSKIMGKKIIFCGTFKDKRIPYEFLLVEYCNQKIYNPNTFIYITKGKHAFVTYTQDKLKLVFEMVTETDNHKTEPLQGLIMNDKLIEFYKYRKKITKKYFYGIETYKKNKFQRKKLRKIK